MDPLLRDVITFLWQDFFFNVQERWCSLTEMLFNLLFCYVVSMSPCSSLTVCYWKPL